MPRLRAAPVLTALGGAPLGSIASISVGGWGQACARTTADRGLCWGDGGSVGHGIMDDALVPVDVIDAVSIAAGMGHVCAAKADGSAWCWGSEDHSRIGNGTGDGWDGGSQLTPTPVLDAIGGAPITGIRSVAAGAVSCAVTTGGAALCWGDDKYGQAATLDNVKTPEPVQARAGGHLTGVDRIWAHYTRTCAQLVDGRVTCWGKNNLGQLGDGTFVNRGAPTTLAVSCP